MFLHICLFFKKKKWINRVILDFLVLVFINSWFIFSILDSRWNEEPIDLTVIFFLWRTFRRDKVELEFWSLYANDGKFVLVGTLNIWHFSIFFSSFFKLKKNFYKIYDLYTVYTSLYGTVTTFFRHILDDS